MPGPSPVMLYDTVKFNPEPVVLPPGATDNQVPLGGLTTDAAAVNAKLAPEPLLVTVKFVEPGLEPPAVALVTNDARDADNVDGSTFSVNGTVTVGFMVCPELMVMLPL